MFSLKFEKSQGALENLLHQYECSTGSLNGAVPVEILQSATRIDDRHANMQHAGPTDAVDTDGDDEEENADLHTLQPPSSKRYVDYYLLCSLHILYLSLRF